MHPVIHYGAIQIVHPAVKDKPVLKKVLIISEILIECPDPVNGASFYHPRGEKYPGAALHEVFYCMLGTPVAAFFVAAKQKFSGLCGTLHEIGIAKNGIGLGVFLKVINPLSDAARQKHVVGGDFTEIFSSGKPEP